MVAARLISLLLTTSTAVLARPQTNYSTPTTLTSPTLPTNSLVSNAVPTVTLSTSVPSPTLSLGAPLPSQAALPPAQAWCPSKIFCAGPVSRTIEGRIPFTHPIPPQLLQTINIAGPYADSKTFVDKPTNGTAAHALADFNAIAMHGHTNITEGNLVQFLEQDFVRASWPVSCAVSHPPRT